MQTTKLIKKIKNSYKLFLESYIIWEKYSLVFGVPKISVKWNENLINDFQRGLRLLTEKHEWLILNTIKTQKWTIVENIEFIDNISYLKFIWKQKDFECFCLNIEYINTNLSVISNWIKKNTLKINLYNKKWKYIIDVVKYFLLNSNSNLYIRELPIKVHTKFIENNKKIIDELLQFVNERQWWIFSFEWNTFEEKYWLKIKPCFVRFRYLDNNLNSGFLWTKIDDISLIIDDFKNLDIKCNKVFIIENEINYLTFPKIKDSIVIWWKWFNISNLKNIDWLKKLEIYYWWDIDSHWFKILAQCRKYYSQTKSILMDMETYGYYKQYEVKWKIITDRELKNLTDYLDKKEYSLLEYLNKNNLRLEQENIDHEYVKISI